MTDVSFLWGGSATRLPGPSTPEAGTRPSAAALLRRPATSTGLEEAGADMRNRPLSRWWWPWPRVARRQSWEEPAQPPWLRINPDADVDAVPDRTQPGDLSMRQAVEEFLVEGDEE